MSDEIRVNRPQPQSQRYDASQTPMASPDSNMTGPSRSSKTPWIILGAVVVILLVVGALFREKLFGGSMKPNGTVSVAKSSGYQAVFLTNGQVYFGKMSNISEDYATLKDIYYLQVVQPPLQGQAADQAQAQQQAAAQPQISLVKLGNELHGPVDEMHISKSQVLFYEDMKDDSQVVKAIEAYKVNPTGTPTPTTPTPAQ